MKVTDLDGSFEDLLRGTEVAPRPSISRVIASALRASIIKGTLAPGQPLRQDVIARHFSASAIPVREAFRELETEGWIIVELNKGATVSLLSADEAREIYEIRAALESLAIGLAIPEHTKASLDAVEASLQAATDEAEQSLYVLRNEQFHMNLYAPVGRLRLLKMIENMCRRGERYLRLKFGLPSVKGESDAEHKAIFEAVCRRDIPAAQALVAQHLFNTGELLFHFLSGANDDTLAGRISTQKRDGTRPSKKAERSRF